MKVRAKFKNFPKDLIKNRKDNKKFSIVTVISIDQPSQNGEKFNAFIKKLNNFHGDRTVENLIIVLTDYLQRHYLNLNESLTDKQVNKKTQEIARDWLENNKNSLKNLNTNIQLSIISWSKIIESDSFKVAFAKVKMLYKESPEFKKVVDEVSQKFSQKTLAKIRDLNEAIPETISRATTVYLLEEASIWGYLLPLKFDFITYPGTKNPVVEFAYDYFSKNLDKKLPWIRYCFEKKSSQINTETPVQPIKKQLMTDFSTATFFKQVFINQEYRQEKYSKDYRRNTL